MCFFKKRRQKRKDKKAALNNSQNQSSTTIDAKKNDHPKVQPVSSKEKVESLKARPFTQPDIAPEEPKDLKKNPGKQETIPVVRAKPTKKKATKKTKKYLGRYEIYPENDFYKFRLKASNGEILCVSFRYSTEVNARSGIETFVKNVEEGQFEVVTDKSGYSQFFLYNQSGARFIMVGEVYKDVKQAHSAVESVKNFYLTDKIDLLDEIPKTEMREFPIEFEKVDQVDTGKYEIIKNNAFYYIRLRASNGQILFDSQGYSSKAAAKSGLSTIQKAIEDKNFTISRDKQNRYQFNLYSSRGQLILAGETYPVKASGVSAAHSVLKFGLKASIVEL